MAEVIEMPKLSDTMTVGTLVKWLVKEGEPVASGDILCEVETDKATMEVDNFADGIVLKHYVPEGGQVPVGSPICAIGEEGEEAPDHSAGGSDAAGDQAAPDSAKKESSTDAPAAKSAPAETAEDEETAPEAEPVAATGDGKRLKSSPLARKIAADKGIDLQAIRGSGPGGRIVKADVLAAAIEKPKEQADRAAAPAAPTGPALGEDVDRPVSSMRGAIARRLLESKTQIPHFYLEIEVDAAPLAQLRAQLNAQLAELPPEQGGIKLTINDLIMKAAAEALRRVPAVNSSWNETSIRQHGAVHLAFGVAIEDGLLTPVIRDAESKSLRAISREAKELIAKARNKKLKPDEMSGSTFTVTNLGMYGISGFFGIINPPNAAILSVGAGIKKPVIDASGNIVPGQRMMIGLSGDHRVIDGASGAEYLAALKQILESPSVMLV